jgi:hypothetical protein
LKINAASELKNLGFDAAFNLLYDDIAIIKG